MLKGSYTKYFKFQSTVTVDTLRSIDKYLHSRCDKVIYNFETSDGADYNADNIEDIVNYLNPSNAKIERVSIIAQNDGKYVSQNHIIVKFYNKSRWDSSASLYITDANSDEIIAVSKELGDIIKQTKADHSWIYSRWVFFLINLALSAIITIISYTYLVPIIKENNASWWFQIFILQVVILVPLLFGFIKAIEWAYPETIFEIGAQKLYYKKLLSRRKSLLGLLLTIILGIISSIIASKYF